MPTNTGTNNNDVMGDFIPGSMPPAYYNYDAFYGLDGHDSITGGSDAEYLNGGAGNDTLDGGVNADTMVGGDGNDTYYVGNGGDVVTESANQGTDLVISTVNVELGANIENLTLAGTNHTKGYGNALNNTIRGNSGNNLLDGTGGIDTMIGGLGDDTYYVGHRNDVITELADEGIDKVFVAADYTMHANVENAEMLGTNHYSLYGNSLDNIMIGNGGFNYLNGGLGNDTMQGRDGNDAYRVNAIGDQVIELENEGTDTVQTTIDYTLGANVENLVLLGNILHISGVGNELDNIMIGNAGGNDLAGMGGNDVLLAGLGNDNARIHLSQSYTSNLDIVSDEGGSDALIIYDLEDMMGLLSDQSITWDEVPWTATALDLYDAQGNLLADADGFLDSLSLIYDGQGVVIHHFFDNASATSETGIVSGTGAGFGAMEAVHLRLADDRDIQFTFNQIVQNMS